ncbi:ABC transporter permease [Nocardioides cavernaquae]|uniref:ABC transporter permease n=1 Tax=Nocardioides cavernaquae TaxID=2321396 RepID=A0A3A5HAB8_9ACTN|nr:ABC transporter permease [Nocardioides cavernaquae]RJS44994.1 ABC transporter permease [Nocardioides cavernaquae]
MSLLEDVMGGGVRGGTSIMYAALGETIGERAGVINLGTEGSMLVGALGAYAIAVETGDPWWGVVAGAVAGGMLSGLHAYLVVRRGASQFASGLSLLFLALGLTSLFGAAYVGQPVVALGRWDVPVLSDLPVLGPILFRHDPLIYLSYALVPLTWWVLFRTRIGLLVRTAGERSDSLEVNGYSAARIRAGAVVVGGMFAGLGGAHLSIAYANAWFENMVSGRGFIAVALVIFAVWSPLRVMGGAYLFGMAIALGPALQARGSELNQFALDVIPFLLTLIVLAVLGRRTLSAAPAELKRVFENST